jgi:hypothetical protein
MHAHPRSWTTCLGAVLLGALVGLGLRLAVFQAAATSLGSLSQLSSAVLNQLPFLDPVYTQAAVGSLVNLHVQGLAVAGPPGDWLHARWPAAFVDSSRAHWALARLAIQPGSAVLARLLASGIAHATVLGVGLLLAWAGLTRRHLGFALAGVTMQLQVALVILGAQPSVRDLQATGMAFAANALLPWFISRGNALTDGLEQLWSPLQAALLVGSALLLAYIPATVMLLLSRRARRVTFATAASVVLMSSTCAAALQQDVGLAAPASVAQPATRATLATGVRLDDWFSQTQPQSQTQAQPQAPSPPQAPTQATSAVLAPTAQPSHVEISGSAYQFQYLVNGEPVTIKGMGLNTQYASQMSPEDRAAQLDSDMASLSALGVNTVLGWDPNEFDATLLDAAQRHGIGVIMPFDLDTDADYTDPNVRQQIHDEVMAWVTQYRAYPALRMWGIGNEVLHKIVHPAWVGPQDPHQELEAEAFSDFLIQTADDIHALDPDHPVTYRDAEDAFVGWLVAAEQRNGNTPRPWFVFGTNCYQSYLGDIVDRWPSAGLQTALWVSEFAPGGMAVPDRPDGFATMWGLVTRHPEYVLGGAVYAWTRNGPEGVDRNFGLTDDGVPVDGRSLDMLESLFHRS